MKKPNVTAPSLVRTDTGDFGDLVSLSPISSLDTSQTRELLPYWLLAELVTYLAVDHFNERNNNIVTDLQKRLKRCDLRFNLTLIDTRFDEMVACSKLYERVVRPNKIPIAIVGAVRSSVTTLTTILSGALGIPQISARSTSPELDNRETFPYSVQRGRCTGLGRDIQVHGSNKIWCASCS